VLSVRTSLIRLEFGIMMSRFTVKTSYVSSFKAKSA